MLRYPEVKIVCNAKTVQMIKQFFTFDIDSRAVLVKEMDTLCTGRHTLAFVMAPMVHWPEAMVTYDTTDKVLFSADAFGTFGAINGNLFADEVNFETEYLDEARRYYTNIVGKYGTQVQTLLRKAATIDIQTICPLHGPVWRKNIGWFIDKYRQVEHLHARGKRRDDRLCLRLRQHGQCRGHSRLQAGGPRAFATSRSTTCPTPIRRCLWPRPSAAAIWYSPPRPTMPAFSSPWRRCCTTSSPTISRTAPWR